MKTTTSIALTGEHQVEILTLCKLDITMENNEGMKTIGYTGRYNQTELLEWLQDSFTPEWSIKSILGTSRTIIRQRNGIKPGKSKIIELWKDTLNVKFSKNDYLTLVSKH